ncbi:MAG: YkgJ family cysteine cluster protein [Desulfovibrio sp.]|uniref:YkgJ family cysteine cluster protein n=1 Tax=Desulfovibrio sp. 7SRBS1 TaxID=3378064 RepID=UPI003B3FEE6A
MDLEMSDLFRQYEELVAGVDKVFENVRSQFPSEVKCKVGCSSCCHAIFDLSLVEAMYLNRRFNEKFAGLEREDILQKADNAEREQAKIVRHAWKDKQKGRDDNEVLAAVGKERVRCPLLDKDDCCQLYDHRPITCRLYGIPTAFDGASHTCGLSGFQKGKPYPAVQMEKIQDRLVALSAEIVQRCNSQFGGLHVVHVPVGSALKNTYDEEYLGAKEEAAEEGTQGE